MANVMSARFVDGWKKQPCGRSAPPIARRIAERHRDPQLTGADQRLRLAVRQERLQSAGGSPHGPPTAERSYEVVCRTADSPRGPDVDHDLIERDLVGVHEAYRDDTARARRERYPAHELGRVLRPPRFLAIGFCSFERLDLNRLLLDRRACRADCRSREDERGDRCDSGEPSREPIPNRWSAHGEHVSPAHSVAQHASACRWLCPTPTRPLITSEDQAVSGVRPTRQDGPRPAHHRRWTAVVLRNDEWRPSETAVRPLSSVSAGQGPYWLGCGG